MKNVLFFLIICTKLLSQNVAEINDNDLLIFETNSKARLFGDNVRFRKKPNIDSEEIQLLKINDEVKVISETEFFKEINGLKSRWLKIEYNNEEGYILDNFISTNTFVNENYITLINYKKDNENKLFLRFRLYDILEETYKEYDYLMPHSSVKVDILTNKGLESISNIIHVDYIAEACGMEGGAKYILLNDDSIADEIELNEISEAGMFWQTEKIIFSVDDNNIERNSFKFIQEIGNVIDEASLWYKKTIIERQHRVVDGKITPEFKSEKP